MSVYFVTCRDANAVKIGLSIEPHSRLGEIQWGCPLPLKLEAIVPGDHEEEHRYHKWFADDRIHGEWFRITTMIETIIAQNPAPELPPDHSATARANADKGGSVSIQPRKPRQERLARVRAELETSRTKAPKAFDVSLLSREDRKRIASGDIHFPFRAKVPA